VEGVLSKLKRLSDNFIGLTDKAIEKYEKKVSIEWIMQMAGYVKELFYQL